MKRCLIALLAIVLVLALPVALYAQETDPASVMRAELDAMIAGDYDTAWTFWADDAVFTQVMPWETLTLTGKEEIRAWLEDLIKTQGWKMHEAEILKVEGDTVTTRMRNSIESVRALGIPWVEGMEVEVIRDGKIVSVTWTMSEESAAAIQAALPETGSAVEEYKVLVRRLIEEVWKGNLDVLAELFAPNAVVHIPPDPAALSLADYKQLAAETHAGFPDTQLELEAIIAAGDKVAVRWTASGTHTGEYLGIAPTGTAVKYPVHEIFHLADGKITASWTFVDFWPLYIQLGVNPPPFETHPVNTSRFPAPAAPEASDEIGTLLHRFFEELWEGGNLDVTDEIMAPDYYEENSWGTILGFPPISSAEGYKENMVTAARADNPELNNRAEDVVAAGDMVAVRYTLRGISVQAGQPLDYEVIAIQRIADGKFQEGWQIPDALTWGRQLGLIPPTLPTTGGDLFADSVWLVALGGLAVLAGLALRRWRHSHR
ncbi:MAG: ester cyclase [Anaerolineae bacterium]